MTEAHTTATGTEPNGSTAQPAEAFDLDGYVAGLKDTPKEQYGDPADAPKGAEAEAGAGGGTGAGPAPEPEPQAGAGAEPSAQSKRTAEFIMLMYNRAQGNVFSILAKDTETYPPERFFMSDSERKEATGYLAIGLEKNGSFEMPWYVPLILVVGMHAFANYQVLQQAKRTERRYQRPERPVHATTAPPGTPSVDPTSIRMPNGEHRPYTPDTRPAKPAPARPAPARTGGPCSECGDPCRPGRTTCGQSCSAKRTHRLRAEAKAEPIQSTAPTA